MKMQELFEKPTRKTFFILAAVTVLYTIFRYEGSAEFFMLYMSRSSLYETAQAKAFFYQRSMALVLLGAVPVLIVKLGFRERLVDYGIGLTRPLLASLSALLGILFITPITFFGSRNPELAAFYPQIRSAGSSPILFLQSSLFYLLYYVGYEFCFRGFLFMGIRESVGEWEALGVSLLASVLLHVTQPQSEMLLSILAGVAFPIFASIFRSIWPGVIIHAYTGISLDYWSVVNQGGFAFPR